MSLDELAGYSRMGDYKEADLAGKLAIDPDGDLFFLFGKHQGEKVRQHLDYADWMLGANFPGSTCDALRAEMARLESGGGR
jgi:hypothetical protein